MAPALRCNAGLQRGECRRMPDGSQVGRSASTTLLTLPNVITFARLCAVPLSVWLVLEHAVRPGVLPVPRGRAVRRGGRLAGAANGGGNAVGALLDPVADKALVTMYSRRGDAAGLAGHPGGVPRRGDRGGIVVLSLLGQSVLIRPLSISKLNTALQIVLVAVSLLLSGFGLAAPMLMKALVWLVAATTFGSGAAYVWRVARPR